MPRLVSLNVSKPGIYNADPNLYLIVRPSRRRGVTRSWVFRFQRGFKVTDIGLGPAHTIGLAQARDQARAYRELLLRDIDPKAHRDGERAKQAAKLAAAKTFDQVAAEYMREHAASWVERHHAGWVGTLRDHVSPVIGAMRVSDVDTPAVLRVLKRDDLWTTKTKTAANVRSRIERILAFAAIHGYAPIDRQNPAAWTGHLKEGLPAPNKVHTVKPMLSLPYGQVPALMQRLGQISDSMPAIMVAFAAHTAVRSFDIRHARRSDIDRDPSTGSGSTGSGPLWIIARLSKSPKGKPKEHRVPLTDAALALADRAIALSACRSVGGRNELLFPNPYSGFEFDDNFAGKLFAKLGLAGTATLHGFRSSFRTWAAEVAEADHVVAELCLGHEVGSAVVKAYQRGDLLRRRTVLMEKWSAFLTGAEGKVVPLKRAKRG
jgi:integrase